LVAVDEAYYPFSEATVLPWVKQQPHLLVVRTFSKAAGLAGLRIGYVVGNEAVVTNLSKVRSLSDVNAMAILCARQILTHPQVLDDSVSRAKAGGDLLARRARELGLVPLPSHANFMLIKVAHRLQPKDVVERLIEHGYLAKGPFDSPCLAECIRVTLGPPELMADFSFALEQVIEG